MKTALVVFDLAGTTVKDLDFVPSALQEAFALEGIEIPLSIAKKVMGLPKPVAINQILMETFPADEIDRLLIEDIHQNFIEAIIEFYKTSPHVEETEGVTDTFRSLKSQNIKIGINTGFDRPTTDILLDRLSWVKDGLVDAVVTSDEVPRGRPYPDMIYKLMQLTNVENRETVVKVGDTESDLLEGQAAGCGMVVGVTTGAYSEADLKLLPHSFLIKNIPELLQCLNIYNSRDEAVSIDK